LPLTLLPFESITVTVRALRSTAVIRPAAILLVAIVMPVTGCVADVTCAQPETVGVVNKRQTVAAAVEYARFIVLLL
jgi:hypothetical protein